MKENLTQRFVRSLQVLAEDEIDVSALHQAKRCLLDYLGSTFAGSTILRAQGYQLLSSGYETIGGATVIGLGAKAGLETATLVNGLFSHVAEMDDGVRYGMIHPGSPILSCLLPAAERYSVQGTDLLRGIAIGYDAALRLASAIQPTHYQRGYHPTSTCGSIGAAMGLGAMLGYDAVQMEQTLAAASVSASGSLKVVDDSSMLKPFNAGRAAVIGLLSAQMARAGLAAPHDALSGQDGFLAMMCDSYDIDRLLEPCPSGNWIHQTYVKPYAACRHAHPSIEACLRIAKRTQLKNDQIVDVKVRTYGGLAGRHDHRVPTSVDSARMSIPFGVALALVFGRAGISEFTDENVANPEVREVAARVAIIADETYTSWVPERRAALVEITTINGQRHQEMVEYPKGEPENPMTDAEMEEKFLTLAKYARQETSHARTIAQLVWDLPDDIQQLFIHL